MSEIQRKECMALKNRATRINLHESVLHHTKKFRLLLRHDLVVDVVASLSRLLKYYSGFFQEIYKNNALVK